VDSDSEGRRAESESTTDDSRVSPSRLRSRWVKARAPTPIAASPASASTKAAPGRRMAASVVSPGSRTIRATAGPRLARPSRPTRAASTAVTSVTLPSRTTLSSAPKVRIAHSLTGVGVESMIVEPTASTGDDCGATIAATRCPTPTPAAAASIPIAAYLIGAVGAPMVVVRRRTPLGLGGVSLATGSALRRWRSQAIPERNPAGAPHVHDASSTAPSSSALKRARSKAPTSTMATPSRASQARPGLA